jgi:hypothetical protein
MSCVAEVIGALAHVRFPQLGGVWEFRLSTGLPTSARMLDWVLADESVKALRELRETLKREAKAK